MQKATSVNSISPLASKDQVGVAGSLPLCCFLTSFCACLSSFFFTFLPSLTLPPGRSSPGQTQSHHSDTTLFWCFLLLHLWAGVGGGKMQSVALHLHFTGLHCIAFNHARCKLDWKQRKWANNSICRCVFCFFSSPLSLAGNLAHLTLVRHSSW